MRNEDSRPGLDKVERTGIEIKITGLVEMKIWPFRNEDNMHGRNEDNRLG